MIKMSQTKMTFLVLFAFTATMASCRKDMPDRTDEEIAREIEVDHLSQEMIKVRDYVMDNAVIAHRGSTYWMPEETEAAFRWARNIGADYIEADLQMTKDGVIIALHDDNLQRTTDIGNVFPYKQDAYVYELTYEELLQLDAGSWFNTSSPNQARPSFAGLQVMTLEDMIRIAEGKRIVKDADGKRVYTKEVIGKNDDGSDKVKYTFQYEDDPDDNGNRPGIYIEFKEPWMFPTIEKDTYEELDRLGWNIITNPQTDTEFFRNGKVNTGNTNGRVVLQTFSAYSILKADEVYKGRIPMCYLLWLGDSFLKTSDDPRHYADAIDFAVNNGCHFTGPSIAGAPNNYDDLLKLWQAQMTHRSGLKIHAYSFDSLEQMMKYYGLRFGLDANGKPVNPPLTDAMFTNRAEITIQFYLEQGVRPSGIAGNDLHPEEVLEMLGY